MKNNREVKNGCIDFYYSLKLETKLRYEQLCKNLCNKVSKTITEYNIRAEATLKNEIEKSISDLNLEELKNLNLKTNYEHKPKDEKKIDIETFSKAVKDIKLEITDTGFKIIPILDLDKEFDELYGESESDYIVCSKIYGKAFTNNCERIILPPFKVQLINDEIVFVRAMLYIFTNEMMVLRISLPIQNVEINPLFEKDSNKYIKNVIDEYSIGINNIENTVEELKCAYFNYIKSSSKKITKIISTSATLENIILADYDGIPDNVTNLTTNVIETLYRIAVAPIEIRSNNNSFTNKATKYIQDNSVTFDVVRYITSSMGRCISIIDKNVVESFETEISEKDILYKSIINSIRINIEFALIIILLKKINSGYTYFQKENKFNNVHKIQEEYLYNKIFILQLQQSCYGSVRDQITFLEEKLTYYIATKDINEKMNAIDFIITEDRAKKNLRFQNFLSIGGVLLTTIFGLPAIYETLSILKKCLFFDISIPIITIENTSVVIWLVLMVFVALKVLFNKINCKRHL